MEQIGLTARRDVPAGVLSYAEQRALEIGVERRLVRERGFDITGAERALAHGEAARESLVGRFGGEVRRFALKMVREELIHNVTSDTHDPVRRPPGTAAELRTAGLGPLEDWLTEEVPTAILDGGEIPPRPEVELPEIEPVRRTWWRRRP